MKQLISLIFFCCFGTSIAQNNDDFQGICSEASVSNVRGAEGINSAKPLSQERFYSVSGNSKQIRLERENKSKTYEVVELVGEFGNEKSMAFYTLNREQVLIYFREKGKSQIFNIEYADGQTHTWGSCILAFKKEITPIASAAGNIVFEKIKKEDFIKFNRGTVQGDLNACELEFQHAYRDVRALSGMPVQLTGSFSVRRVPSKATAFLLKINAAAMETSGVGWKVMKPKYTNITVTKKSFQSNFLNEFTCESGGRCAVYQDPKWELYAAVLVNPAFDAELGLSLVEGGTDYTFKLSELMPKASALIEQRKFHDCALELAKK